MKDSKYRPAAISLLLGAIPVLAESTGIATKHCLRDPPPALRHDGQLRCPPPIDESTGPKPVDWSPWTHRPECVESEKDPGVKYCVYSNSRHGDQGISIITKPKTAADSAGMLNEEFPGATHLIPRYRATLLSTCRPRAWVSWLRARLLKPRRSWRIGRLVVLDLSFPKAMQKHVGHQYLHLASDQLADPERVLGLGRSSTAAVDIMEDILGTNSFSYTLGGDAHMALYPEVARINHACKPNAFVRFSPTSFDVKVVAFRDIEAGEEITISYIPMNHPREKRQRDLRRWGFECKCSLCTASKTEIATSDYRREKIASLQENVMKAISELDGTTAVRASYDILELAKAEDIHTMVASQYEVIARLFWKAGDVETATKYAQKSLDTHVELGYIDSRPDDLELLLKDFTT
ncbi:hypothetical protein NUW58_g7723 [Xylaria curta]|uniref:Uncharacterized protein n=1 Tax=Xylaria curta TaxID=42375 RepID=A0ACC1NGT1_9PEZI|nr:hypothetical protein NUW58_g7723 [Xylaria curta]